MPFLGRAFYNLLQMNLRDEETVVVEPWQIENLREVPLEALFTRLDAFAVRLTTESFKLYAEQVDSPEELYYCLTDDSKKEEDCAKIYLLLFELWRRLCPDKKSISIFCDELDYEIYLYDHSSGTHEENLQKLLLELQDILDLSVDKGQKPRKVFDFVCDYCAHDLESFLFDFAYDQIEQENETTASELIDNFYSYVKEKLWFDFLRLKLFSTLVSDEARLMSQRFIERLSIEKDLELDFEVLRLFTQKGDDELFFPLLRQAMSQLKKEEDFIEFLSILGEYYTLNDLDEKAKFIESVIESRNSINQETEFNYRDKDLKNICSQLGLEVSSLGKTSRGTKLRKSQEVQ